MTLILDTYIKILKAQLYRYSKALFCVGLALLVQPLTVCKSYSMADMDKQLNNDLKLKLAAVLSDAGMKGAVADHLFNGARCMRRVRDFNIAQLGPRLRLLAGYRGLCIHKQSIAMGLLVLLGKDA